MVTAANGDVAVFSLKIRRRQMYTGTIRTYREAKNSGATYRTLATQQVEEDLYMQPITNLSHVTNNSTNTGMYWYTITGWDKTGPITDNTTITASKIVVTSLGTQTGYAAPTYHLIDVKGWDALTDITLPTGIEFFQSSDFTGCSNLKRITINRATPPLGSSTMFSSTAVEMIFVPAQSVYVYKAAEGWSGYANMIFAI